MTTEPPVSCKNHQWTYIKGEINSYQAQCE